MFLKKEPIKRESSQQKSFCCNSIDVEFEAFCLEDVQKMALQRRESKDDIEFWIKNDLELIQKRLQVCVNLNNQKAQKRVLLQEREAKETITDFAAVEERLNDLFLLFLQEYQTAVQKDSKLNEYRLTLYFDTHFVDFDKQLQQLDKKSISNPLEHPFYLKLYQVTSDKLAIIYRVYLDNIKELNQLYVENHEYLVDIVHQKKRYSLEYQLLIEEFTQYATSYLKSLGLYEKFEEAFLEDLKTLQERFRG